MTQFRCSHPCFTSYIVDDDFDCDKSCDFCSDGLQVEHDWEDVENSGYAARHLRRVMGKTQMLKSVTPDVELDGRSRKGGKE